MSVKRIRYLQSKRNKRDPHVINLIPSKNYSQKKPLVIKSKPTTIKLPGLYC